MDERQDLNGKGEGLANGKIEPYNVFSLFIDDA